MKKNFIFQLLLVSGLAVIFTTLKSDSTGKYNGGTACSSCHGNMNANTTVALNGLPSTFVTGQTYPLTFTVTNATNLKAGFNILASGGMFTAGTGSKVNGAKTQITHTAPMVASGTTSTFSFSWTAPNTTAAVTFNAVGNAVNGNNTDDSGDQWNATTASVNGSFPTGVPSVEQLVLNCYPNPTTDYLTLENISKDSHILLFDMAGKKQQFSISQASNNACVLDCSSLKTGMYLIHVSSNHKTLTTTFEKK